MCLNYRARNCVATLPPLVCCSQLFPMKLLAFTSFSLKSRSYLPRWTSPNCLTGTASNMKAASTGRPCIIFGEAPSMKPSNIYYRVDGYQECLHCQYTHPSFSIYYPPTFYTVKNSHNFSQHIADPKKPDDGLFLYTFPNSTINVYGGGMVRDSGPDSYCLSVTEI